MATTAAAPAINLQKLIPQLIMELRSSTGSSVPAIVKAVVATANDDSPTASKEWSKKVVRSLKKLVAERDLEIEVMKEIAVKKW